MSSRRTRNTPHRKQLIAERGNELRASSTWSEHILWQAIRARQLGVQFRRQVPVGCEYIADFLCSELRLIVEVDGPVHCRSGRRDARRDRRLRELGFTVLRVDAAEVVHHVSAALQKIRVVIAAMAAVE